MERIIKVEEIDMMGYSGDTKYFKSLKKAKRYFKKLFNKHKCELAESDDAVEIINSKDTIGAKGRRYKSIMMELIKESDSENGTEYDTEFITITLMQIYIED